MNSPDKSPAIVSFTVDESGDLGEIMALAMAYADTYEESDPEFYEELSEMLGRMNQRFMDSFNYVDSESNKAVRNLRSQGWDNARDHIQGIPCWFADSEHHGFDLWDDENGVGQEKGARIEVMKILNNNPYSDDYVDPDKARAKRRVTKVRRRMIEEGKDPDNGN